MILVDTSVLIEFFRGSGSEECHRFEDILKKRLPFGINSHIMQEILQGAASEKEFELIRKYLSTQRFYHLKDPVESYISAADIYLKCRKHGITIRSTIDCIIAQTAIEYDLLLLHKDNHFKLISSITPLRCY